jgi:ABC-type dipeptide/oligopeptide/nickel transport system permease subunit
MAGIFKSQHVRNYLRDPSALVGSILLLIFFFCAIFAPLIAPMDPYDLVSVDLGNFLLPPAWMDGSLSAFPLGTDDQGRGILSTILYGLRTSLIVGFSVVAISSVVGIVMGMLAAYYGGILDAVVMRLADTVFAFSTTLLAVLLLGVFETRGVVTVIFAICIADWVKYARTIRGSVLEIKDNAYVVAARSSGAGDFRILFTPHPAQCTAAHLRGHGRGSGRGDHAGSDPELSGCGCTADRTVHRHDDRHRQELHLRRHVVADPVSRRHPDPSGGGHQPFFRLAAG